MKYSKNVYSSEEDLEDMWDQMQEWELFKDSSNYGNLLIVTVPVDSPPNLENWQFQLSLVDSLEDKKKKKKRTGLIADRERLPFAIGDMIVVMVYNEGWECITWLSITKDGEVEMDFDNEFYGG